MIRPDVPLSLSPERLGAALTEVGGSARPDYLDDIVTRAARTRQRPAWTIPERWLPMSNFATAPLLAPVRPLPRVTLRGALTLLTLALLTGAIIGSARLATTPGPLPTVGNGLIAYDSDGDIWVVDPDGTDNRRLTENADDETSPIWSPDGKRLAVWTGADGATVVRILKADGTTEQTIAAPDGVTFPSRGYESCAGFQAAWSPDGRTLAVPALDQDYRDSVALLDVETGVGRILDVGMPVCTHAWSPTGSLLAFTGGVLGAQAVFTVEPDGSDRRRLSPEGRQAWLFQFAPDGTWVLADLEGEGAVMLKLDGTHEALPADAVSVAADGRSAALLRGNVARMYGAYATKDVTSGPREVWVTSLDGTLDERLVADAVNGPGSWSPDSALLTLWTTKWDEILIIEPFTDGEPIRVPSPGNMGNLSWQALH